MNLKNEIMWYIYMKSEMKKNIIFDINTIYDDSCEKNMKKIKWIMTYTKIIGNSYIGIALFKKLW